MSDTAAFFANKKNKKKKAFKFNANLVDASAVTHSIHVDAPALSTDQDPTAPPSLTNTVGGKDGDNARDDDEQWDDAALASTSVARKIVPVHSSAVEVLEMKALDSKRTSEVDIAEKLRLKETKAQLAAAREGMEREAAKLKEEQEKKEEVKSGAGARFSAAASNVGGTSKWLPPHMRGGGSSAALPGVRPGSQKLDVQNEELFPDLASAEKILEQKEKQSQPLFKPPKKTPVGGGASWASKAPVKTAAPAAEAEPEKVAVEEDTAPAPTLDPAGAEASKNVAIVKPPVSAAAKVAAASSPSKDIAAKKPKKKKDLSTFKPKASS